MAEFTSNNDQPAVHATNTGTGIGVFGQSTSNDGVQGVSSGVDKSGVTGLHGGGGNGVFGQSPTGRGVAGISDSGVGIFGECTRGHGVQGQTNQLGRSGVAGHNGGGGDGVSGEALTGRGVFGISDSGVGVFGESLRNDGVQGITSQTGRSGVTGIHRLDGNGVFGQSESGRGVAGISNTGRGVEGVSNGGDGVFGQTNRKDRSGVTGSNTGGGRGLTAVGSPAGHFDGDVEVTGNINCHERSTITCFDVSLTGGDCAEDFDVRDLKDSEPGTVMVVDDSGVLQAGDKPYDKRVIGVISGAGDYKPGIVLDKQGSCKNRKPIALLGKTFCKVDAQYGPVEIGDLLTTSPTVGHAMRADDPLRAFGTVIGKALRPLALGQGLIPILVALQ
jgi:hypothetical protein